MVSWTNLPSAWKLIIRPPRHEYSLVDLGPPTFHVGDRIFERKDLVLINNRGQRLQCSHFRPASRDGRVPTMPCVVYLHGMSSSRLEALHIRHLLLPRGISVFCLDLSGSGRSDGKYVSLGHHEEQDLKVVLRHLRESGEVNAIGLWGRSMGAVTSILRASEDWAIAACVLDSPFSNLSLVMREIVRRQVPSVPDIVVQWALQYARREIKERANFDIQELVPIRGVVRARAPALFAAALDDVLVPAHHSQALRQAWGGNERELVNLYGGHDRDRPEWFLECAADFLSTRLHRAASQSPNPQPTLGVPEGPRRRRRLWPPASLVSTQPRGDTAPATSTQTTPAVTPRCTMASPRRVSSPRTRYPSHGGSSPRTRYPLPSGGGRVGSSNPGRLNRLTLPAFLNPDDSVALTPNGDSDSSPNNGDENGDESDSTEEDRFLMAKNQYIAHPQEWARSVAMKWAAERHSAERSILEEPIYLVL